MSLLQEQIVAFNKEIEDIKSGERAKRVISTGLSNLDYNLCGGFDSGQLIILGARPGVGKSALGVQFAKSAAEQGKRTVFFSLEMPTKELIGRLLASTGRIDYTDIRKAFIGKSGGAEKVSEALKEAEREMASLPLNIYDKGGMFVERMRDVAVEISAEFIVVDYLQLARTKEKYEVREQQVAEISRQLKMLAKELSCPVLALAQLNRQVEMRTNKRPVLSDLRESGSLEQDADVIMFLYREGYYNKMKREDGTTEIIVPKQRAGSPFDIECVFQPENMKFVENSLW